MEQEHFENLTTCPVCAGAVWHHHKDIKDYTVSQEIFHLTTCDVCGFCATNPRPTAAQIGRYYDSPQYISHTNTTTSLQDRIYHTVRQWAIRGKHRLVARHKTTGRVLDVGCGTGEFLGYLKSRGYSAKGVEPGVVARVQAIANHTLEVFPSLEQVSTTEQFNIITMWHVLEHMHDVRATLKKLHAHLSPGGLLVIAVPDRDSWDAQHYDCAWAAFDVPRHLSHFRRADLRRILPEHGFKIMTTKPMWFDAPYVSMLSEKHRGAGALTALLKGTVVGAASNLVALTTSRPTSSSLYLAEKV